MVSYRLNQALCIAFTVFLISCSGGSDITGPNPTIGSTISTAALNLSGHYLWGYFAIVQDSPGGPIEVIPIRQTDTHWNVLKFLEQGPCKNCVQIVGFVDSGNGTKLIDIQISHPFTQKNYTGFDVRGIAMFNGSKTFPESGLNTSDRLAGDGALVNPDGFTTLYNPFTAGSGIGGLQGYLKGKFASALKPNARLNGYKRFISDDPSNTRNAFFAGSSITVTYEIDMPDSAFVVGYAVDASWEPAVNTPVIDPMTDFPPEASCPEPWKITTSEVPGKGLTSGGGRSVLQIDVYDYQGRYSHLPPKIECPELFQGEIIANWASDNIDHSSWQVTVVNVELAPEGKYTCLVSVEDTENAISPDYLDLTAYQLHTFNVSNSGWARTWGGSGQDLAPAVVVDSAGNSVVAGLFEYTGDFDPGPAVDEHTSTGSLDCFVSKYDPIGKLTWAKSFGGAFWDECTGAALDDSGNVYLTGFFSDTADFDPGPGDRPLTSEGDWDIFLLKLNPDGEYLWAVSWGDGYWDMSYDLCINGYDVYVVGEFRGKVDFDPGPGIKYLESSPGASFISKFDTDGIFDWVRGWAGDGGYDDIAVDVATDKTGAEVYVTGVFDGTCDFDPDGSYDNHTSFNFYQDSYLVKYLENGDYEWARTWGNDVDDWPSGIAVNSTGNIYVSGSFGGTVDFDPGPGTDSQTAVGERDAYFSAFDPDGSQIYTRSWGSFNNDNWQYSDSATGVFIDNSDLIYVSGYFCSTTDFDPGPGVLEITSSGWSDAFLSVFDQGGSLLWAKGWGGQGTDQALSVAADLDGNSFASGIFAGAADFDPGEWVDEHYVEGQNDSFLTKFLPGGSW